MTNNWSKQSRFEIFGEPAIWQITLTTGASFQVVAHAYGDEAGEYVYSHFSRRERRDSSLMC